MVHAIAGRLFGERRLSSPPDDPISKRPTPRPSQAPFWSAQMPSVRSTVLGAQLRDRHLRPSYSQVTFWLAREAARRTVNQPRGIHISDSRSLSHLSADCAFGTASKNLRDHDHGHSPHVLRTTMALASDHPIAARGLLNGERATSSVEGSYCWLR